jgi:glucokinase
VKKYISKGMNILVGDVGGTKTHLVLFQGEEWIAEKKYYNREFAHFSDIILTFLAPYSLKVDAICFGVAGPIENGSCKATNLPWTLSENEITQELNVDKVWLINDLMAHGYGVSGLLPHEFETLNKSSKHIEGNRAMIAVGTGLGEVGFYWDGNDYHCFASEGGHCDFAPRNALEIELLLYLQKKYPTVSYERVLSGPGIASLFSFFIEARGEKQPDWVSASAFDDLSVQITQKALKKECPLCVKVVEWFVSVYGSEAGNLALKFLAQGGMYIGGNIARILLPFFKEKEFMKSFTNKGRFSELLSNVSVKLILNEHTAILGAVAFIKRKIG